MAFSWNPFARKQQSDNNSTGNNNPQRNENYQIFNSVNNDIERIVASRSVIGQQIADQALANPIWQTLGVDSNMLLMPVTSNKAERIAQYRKIAKYTECDWCLDEIADEFIHEDENGNFINLHLPDGKKNINETRKQILQEEFERYINLFRLRDEGYNIIKRFLVEGELAWENIIKHEDHDMGIVGVKFLPPEYYETLIDTKTNRPVGLIFDTERFAKDIREILSNNYLGSASIFNAIVPTNASFNFNPRTCVAMLWSQLTYINSGEISLDGNQYVSYPLIEKSKQAYFQLAMMQDAAVIRRVTRAPERLLFNVSTGKMNDNYAQEYVRNFANSLKSKKVSSRSPNGQPDISQVYNPVSMLESYVFGRSDGNEGTSIESVGSSENYEELGDVEYFLRRFMKQFKVPFSRYKTPENAPPAHDQLSAEEHAFLRMIVRFQRRFADGFKKGFITDLKLRGMWEKYELRDADINIEFVKPSLYDLYESQQTLELKISMYKSVADEDILSKMTAMKKYLGMTDAEVRENFENIMAEKMLNELGEYYGGQVAEKNGLAGWEPPYQFKDDATSTDNETSNTAIEDGDSSDEGSSDSNDSSPDESGEEPNEEQGEDKQAEEAAPPGPPEVGLGG